MKLPRFAVFPLLVATSLAAQQRTPPVEQDTALAARLERVEHLVEILRQQLSEQATARVEPRSRNRVELSGLVMVNAFRNGGKVNNSDIPQVALPPDPPGSLPAAAAGASVRQTQLTLTASVPQFARGALTGELDMDFYGGQQPSGGGRTWPLLRVRRVRAEIAWPHAWVMFGQEAPPIAEVNPSSLAGMGLVDFARAGNLWLWIPQARAGAETGGPVKIGLEASLLAPTAGDPQGTFFTQPDRAERSLRPFVQARLRLRWDQPKTTGEVSLGRHYGWLVTQYDTLVTSLASAASVRATATRYLELRGEIFTGQALSGLGGGGIGQNLGVANRAVRTTGGWVQLNGHPRHDLEVGAGAGFDDPDDRDLDPVNATLLNESREGHVQWRPAPLVFGAEVRQLTTTYGPLIGRVRVHHLNLAAGFEF